MASVFWVGGTGTWDAATTTHWSASSGGAGGAAVPTSADTVTFDGASGGGTVTLNFGGTITIQSVAMGAFTGTWDNSVNNNNMVLTAGGSAFNGSGNGTRTIKLGTATYTLSGGGAGWNFASTTNLTYTGNTGANIIFTGSTGTKTFAGAALSHGNVTFGTSTSTGFYQITGAGPTLASLTIDATNMVQFPNAATTTITAAFAWTGTLTSQIEIRSDNVGVAATVAATASSTAAFCGFRDMTFSGSTPVASDSFNFGSNTGITINRPGGTGTTITGGAGVIGS